MLLVGALLCVFDNSSLPGAIFIYGKKKKKKIQKIFFYTSKINLVYEYFLLNFLH